MAMEWQQCTVCVDSVDQYAISAQTQPGIFVSARLPRYHLVHLAYYGKCSLTNEEVHVTRGLFISGAAALFEIQGSSPLQCH